MDTKPNKETGLIVPKVEKGTESKSNRLGLHWVVDVKHPDYQLMKDTFAKLAKLKSKSSFIRGCCILLRDGGLKL